MKKRKRMKKVKKKARKKKCTENKGTIAGSMNMGQNGE